MREFADKYNIPRATVRGWSASKRLPVPDEVVGKTMRWQEEKLQKWLKQYNYQRKERWDAREI